jgi:hypothetical protein
MQDQRVFSIEKNGQMPFVLFLYEEFDDTMAKRKRTKGNNGLQNIHIKLKIE